MVRRKPQSSKPVLPTTYTHYSNPGRKANPPKPSRWRAYLGEATGPSGQRYHINRDKMGLTPWSQRTPYSGFHFGEKRSDLETRRYFQPRRTGTNTLSQWKRDSITQIPYQMRVANDQWRKWNPNPTIDLTGGVPSLQTLARQSIRGLDRYALKPDGSFDPPRR